MVSVKSHPSVHFCDYWPARGVLLDHSTLEDCLHSGGMAKYRRNSTVLPKPMLSGQMRRSQTELQRVAGSRRIRTEAKPPMTGLEPTVMRRRRLWDRDADRKQGKRGPHRLSWTGEAKRAQRALRFSRIPELKALFIPRQKRWRIGQWKRTETRFLVPGTWASVLWSLIASVSERLSALLATLV